MSKLKRFDHKKAVSYIQSGSLLKLKHYIIEFEKKCINFTLDFKTGKQSETLMHLACSFGDDAIVRCLIKHGAKVNIRDRKGNTPMHCAAKYVLDKQAYGSYKLLIDPLLKEFPEGLNEKNHQGSSPMDYLNTAREYHHKACQERARLKAEQEKSSGSEGEDKEEDEEEEKEASDDNWDEKLANAMSADCDDLEDKLPSGSWNAYKLPTFEQWANKIASEYQRKHKFHNPLRFSKTTKRERYMEQREEKMRLMKEQDDYRVEIKKRRVNQLEEKHQKYQEGLVKLKETSSTSTKKLKFKDIPWPCRGTLDEMVEVVMQGVEPGCSTKDRKKFIYRQLILWHPDKFQQRCQDILDEEDKDVILDTVKLLSQALTRLLKEDDAPAYAL